MRICFVSSGTLRAFRESVGDCFAENFAKRFQAESADLILFGFNGIGEVSYEKELKGESDYFEDAAVLSRLGKTAVVCGCITDTRGHRRKSALVAESGRLVGVSDMLYAVDGEVGCGAALRVYDTKIGKMGVAVAEDLNFPDVVRALALCGSDFIVCPFGRCVDEMQSVLLRAKAYTYGIPILFCSVGYSMIADASGKIVFASSQSAALADFQNVKTYHLIETRRRGKGI